MPMLGAKVFFMEYKRGFLQRGSRQINYDLLYPAGRGLGGGVFGAFKSEVINHRGRVGQSAQIRLGGRYQSVPPRSAHIKAGCSKLQGRADPSINQESMLDALWIAISLSLLYMLPVYGEE